MRQCHAAAGPARPRDEFAAAFYLALGEKEADRLLPGLGAAQDGLNWTSKKNPASAPGFFFNKT